MKTIIFAMILSAAVIFFTACQSAPTTTVNTNTNARANTDAVSNSNSNAGGMNHAGMNHSEMNHSEMNHSDMKSSPNAASAPYDLQFLDTMTHHHQGALDMAKVAAGKTNNQELKAFAQKIIADQNKEIAQMKDWREKWFAGKPAAMNMEMPGMAEGMKMMAGDEMKKWEATSGKDFDLMFLDMMTPHHAGAIVMSKEALTKAERPEIKTLANQIIKAQEEEIRRMQAWKTAWSK